MSRFKYPLLLDQLRNKRARTQSAVDSSTRPSMRTDVGEYELGLAAVDRAGEAMRLVVSLVNRASDLRVQITRSALIWSRMLLTNPPVSQSPPSPPAGLTHDFVASLGACHLAGALDVVHHPSVLHMPSGGLKAKYYGAFLYMGGYLILVKIPKGGKVYEPRFWLSLVGFDVFDLEEEDVSLPHSFHLCGHGHHLQLAAACQPEKVIWMSAIQEVLSATPHWTNEPMSSLQAGEKPEATSPVDDAPAEWTATHLPTIQSLSDLESQGDESNPAAPARPKSRLDNRSRPPSRMDCISFRQDPQTPTSFSALTRRSSSASVRQHVDQGLRDVFSQNCVAARSQALLREEELFHARKKTTMSRSNSGLSITGAMTLAAKRRYDSVLVSRRKGSVDVPADQLNDLDDGGKNLATLSRRAKSLASRRRKKPLPSIVPMVASELSKVESEAEADIPASQSPAALLESPFAASQCSSNTSSNAESVLPSPVDLMGPLLGNVISEGTIRQTDVVVVTGEEFRPKRTRSMVDNVKYFFHSRPASPCSSSGHPSPSSTPPALVPQEHDTWREPPGGFVHWWRKGSLRRRVQSSPDMPGDDGQPAVPGRASADSRGSFLVKVQPSTTVEGSSSSTPEPGEKSPGNSRRVAFNDSLPTRRRSLFVPSSRQRDPSSSPQVTPDASPSSTARRSLRNMWRFQRSNSFTPMDMSKPKA
ncbi:hypothetical protein WOLCODRAFT_24277 [Wolfiporia cocos MD-104 SS10]|uniref:PH domain-containing protein n=1 Tax=Wolfiporia cocos (strain MD-104) TaxID=742152 RepID=A0A2H3JPS2_WOLCO|nr:hypothetical protein WOLCODRAFT_24277 [Wolfiporia cocos MD-104 SS10]